jgi:hypothetical protein
VVVQAYGLGSRIMCLGDHHKGKLAGLLVKDGLEVAWDLPAFFLDYLLCTSQMLVKFVDEAAQKPSEYEIRKHLYIILIQHKDEGYAQSQIEN